ncbi:MAG: hypothetical protein LBK41_01865 [Clostridiales bacterium]|nr:hypothetical protein [Clostridiales bacterium]
MGTDILAARAIVSNLTSFTNLPESSLQVVATTVVGRICGAGEKLAARRRILWFCLAGSLAQGHSAARCDRGCTIRPRRVRLSPRRSADGARDYAAPVERIVRRPRACARRATRRTRCMLDSQYAASSAWPARGSSGYAGWA